VFAKGIGEEMFEGYYDNTDLFKKLTSIMGVS
jgi:alkaline phosphatase